MFKKYLLISPLRTSSHCHRISVAVGLMCALSLDAQALERPINLTVQITHQSITPETTPVPSDNTGEDGFPLGEPEPIIVGTALIALYEEKPAGPRPLGEPEPIIVGQALLAFYQREPIDPEALGPEPLGEPEPIIVGTVLMSFDEQGKRNEHLPGRGEGVALFGPAADVGGAVVVNGDKLSFRLLWRCGDFWTDRDFMILVASTHPDHAASGRTREGPLPLFRVKH
jgi:hypothetical protein